MLILLDLSADAWHRLSQHLAGTHFEVIDHPFETVERIKRTPVKKPKAIKLSKPARKTWAPSGNGCMQCGGWVEVLEPAECAQPFHRSLCPRCLKVYERSMKVWRSNPEYPSASHGAYL